MVGSVKCNADEKAATASMRMPTRMSISIAFRLWLGMSSSLKLVYWMLASAVESAPTRLLALAIATAVLLGLGIFMLHRQIQRE